MKKILVFIAAAACAFTSWADDVVTAKYNGTKLDVELANSTSFVAFQMDIDLPEGVTVESIDSNIARLKQGANVTINGEDTETPFVIAKNVIDSENNVLRVIAYNLGNNEIKEASGKLFTINFNNAVTEATISNIKFVDQELVEKDLANATAEAGGVFGDVTGEGDVDVEDVSKVLNVSLGAEAFDANCDLTGEGDVDVEDVSIVLNLSLGI